MPPRIKRATRYAKVLVLPVPAPLQSTVVAQLRYPRQYHKRQHVAAPGSTLDLVGGKGGGNGVPFLFHDILDSVADGRGQSRQFENAPAPV